jgi:hypothetical protein
MKISTKPTSQMLVGILFICIFLGPALAESQSNDLGLLNKLKEHQHQKSSELGILKVGADTIHFPWYSRQILFVRPALPGSISTSAKKEEILMDSTNSTANVRDLLAMNSLKQRDLLYKDSLNGYLNNSGIISSQDISVSGKANDKSADEAADMGEQEDGIGGRRFEDSDSHHVGNYLSIDVHGISVSAINTMQGGSAVATSNIIIEPVQIVVCPSEVDTKLI